MTDILRLAHGVLFPGVGRKTLPRWASERLDRGLGGFVVYGKDIVSSEQLHALTAEIHRLAPGAIIAADEEGGDVNRLENNGGTSVPGNFALGRVDDLERTERAAQQLGLTLVRAGIDWNLAPAVDTAVNPFSPNGIRCFGPDRERVAQHSAAWVRGLQGAGVSACAKHFPGHGKSGTDAHLGTPRLEISREELLPGYLAPFRAAIAAGVDSIMVSHVLLTEIDDVPATISRAVLTGILREELGFTGVIITDALEMRGIADFAPLPEAAVRALVAGADALCLGSWAFQRDVDAAAEAICAAVADGRLPLERLQEANERIARLGTRPRGDISLIDDAVGARLAADVVRSHGNTRLAGENVLLISLEPTHSPAAGSPGGAVAPLLAGRGQWVETLPMAEDTYNGLGMVIAETSQFRDEFGAAGEVVLLIRSPHRFAWQAEAIAAILDTHPETIVLDMGVPHEDFSAARGWIQTFGASRVCAEAAVNVLLGADG